MAAIDQIDVAGLAEPGEARQRDVPWWRALWCSCPVLRGRRVQQRRRPSLSWFGTVALLALAPKCLVCLAAYAGVGAAFGLELGSREICGASAGVSAGALSWLAMVGAGLGLVACGRFVAALRPPALLRTSPGETGRQPSHVPAR